MLPSEVCVTAPTFIWLASGAPGRSARAGGAPTAVCPQDAAEYQGTRTAMKIEGAMRESFCLQGHRKRS